MNSENRFVDNGDGTVTDLEKNLMWNHTDSMNDLKKWMNYQDSADYTRELNEKRIAGYDNWRLPTYDEMGMIYDPSYSNTDNFGKEIHIPSCFSSGGGFTMIAGQVPGRMRTWILNIRDGEFSQPDGLWTLADAARAIRTIHPDDNQ